VDQGGQASGKDDAAVLPPFRGNQVRLWLSILAYNLGNLWRRLGLPGGIEDWSLMSLQQRLVEDRRAIGETRAVQSRITP